MKPRNPRSAARVEAESAAWLARRDRGLTAAEQDAFFQWLAEDSRHGDAIAAHDLAWGELDALAEWRPAHSEQPNPDLLARAGATSWLRPRRWLAVGAAAGLAVSAGWFALVQPSHPLAPVAATVVRDSAQRVLEDGSVIDLNHGAAVEVRYTAAERGVWLTEGEAHFTVAKNPARPFVVRAGKVAVRAVGTAFNVRLDPAAVEVLVTEGRVEVAPPAGTAALPILAAGQRARVPDAGAAQIEAVSADEMARSLAWQPRQLEFDAARLADVVAAFNRHNQLQLELGDAGLADIAVGASFRSNNVEGFVRLLESGFGITAERSGNRIILRAAR